MSGITWSVENDRIVRRKVTLSFLAVLAAALLAYAVPPAHAAADEPVVNITPRGPRPQSGPVHKAGTIRADVNAILVPVTVTDAWDRPVQDLHKDDFRLFEDDVEQEITSSSTEDVPVSVGLIFDASGSMGNKISASATAVDQFFKTSIPGDEFLLVRFSDKPQFLTGFTPDAGEISKWLHSIRAAGWTALNDALCLGIQKMRGAKNTRKVLLVLSDGGDNNSRYSTREVRELVREAGVGIYSISFFQGSRLLESISNETGGRMIQVHHLSDLPEAIEKLSRTIRGQYLLSYYSRNPQNDGKYRRVRVELAQPTLRVSWRRGYYAPAD